MALPRCELRQRGTDTPIFFSGPGLVTQNVDRGLVVRVFAPPVEDMVETMNRSFNQDFVPGHLTPETDYYDLWAEDMTGAPWVAERVRVSTSHSFHGTYIQVDPNRLESTQSRGAISDRARLDTFVQGKLDLPWHMYPSSDGRGLINRFDGSVENFTWTVRRADDGVHLSVTAVKHPIEPVFNAFWRALSILTGRALHTEVFWITERQSHTRRIANGYWGSDDARLLVPIRLDLEHAHQAHAFIAAYLRHALGDGEKRPNHNDLVFQNWHRILRARENDIENSALVLSVAIEGVINEAFASMVDEDVEFVGQVETAKAVVKGLKSEIGERAWNWMMSSLGQASAPRAKHVLKRLVEQRAITDDHVQAWTDMRNKSAHGGMVPGDNEAFQAHIDRFHTCLNLFYRLVFIIVGYKGEHQDYSTIRWPDVVFPPSN